MMQQMESGGSCNPGGGGEKESRNFLCYWCDFRGRWRSEIIQHMRCHHAREKPYRCSACMYASNWKWDVQKHTKKQHPNNITAKIVEIPDQVLFPDLKDFNFFDNVKPAIDPTSRQQYAAITNAVNNGAAATTTTAASGKKTSSINLTPPSSASSSSSSSSTSSISSVSDRLQKPMVKIEQQAAAGSSKQSSSSSVVVKTTTSGGNHSLCCAQCPYVACNVSDLRRHLIVHSNEQPYHCCACDFKSKWKSDVKKHQRAMNHIGPILVGKKAMQKVI